MAEPVRKTPLHEHETDDGGPTLQRWRRSRDGSMELLELPLTPELFLDPKIGDTMVQGGPHMLAVHELFERLMSWSRRHPDVLILSDVKHILGRGLARPVPDISVVRGMANPRRSPFASYNVVKVGIPPCLMIEVVSDSDARIRRVDEVDKVMHYQRAGIPEYLLLDLPRSGNGFRYAFQGYRLDAAGLYRPLEPDAQGFIFSESTRLHFGVTADGQDLWIVDDETGEPLRTSRDEADRADRAEQEAHRSLQARRQAESEARREARARREAEEEVARLRAEIERLRGS